jgi:FeS assembly SUF system protein
MAMPDEAKPAESMHLTVLPSSNKVEQLRNEFATDAGAGKPDERKKLAEQNVIDRALDASKTPEQKRIEEKVIEVLRSVYDPEIPVNIYELGLIYDIKVAPDNAVEVKMTLTAPACPVAGTLPPEIERKIETIPEVPRAKVEVVWDPPWTRERMSEAALLELGLL